MPAPLPKSAADPKNPRGWEWVDGLRSHKHFRQMREKCLQWAKDFWRAYHGGLGPRDDRTGSAAPAMSWSYGDGSWPLNAAVLKHDRRSPEGKLALSRLLFERALYALSVWHPAVFMELRDFFGSYGSGDSDFDRLRGAAHEAGPGSEPWRKYTALSFCLDWLSAALIAEGVGNRDFWADFGLEGIPTTRSKNAAEKDRERYLDFLEECEKLQKEGRTRYRTAAMKAVAKRRGEARSTIEEAVAKAESGYIRDEVS